MLRRSADVAPRHVYQMVPRRYKKLFGYAHCALCCYLIACERNQLYKSACTVRCSYFLATQKHASAQVHTAFCDNTPAAVKKDPQEIAEGCFISDTTKFFLVSSCLHKVSLCKGTSLRFTNEIDEKHRLRGKRQGRLSLRYNGHGGSEASAHLNEG